MALPLPRSAWILIGLAAGLAWTAAVFFAGRNSKKCPQILVPPQAVKAPETKPLVPDTVRLKKVVLRVDTVRWADTFWRAETLYREAGGFKPVVFGNRWPHTGDTALVWGKDSITLVPFGFVPQIASVEAARASGGGEGKRNNLLHIGLNWWFDQPAELWGTIPLPRDKRLFYFPHRAGAAYQPKGKDWRLVFEWELLKK